MISTTEYLLDDFDDIQAYAEDNGLIVVEPKENQLQVDIDRDGADTFNEQWPILLQIYPNAKYTVVPSRTLGHLHVTVDLGQKVSVIERLGLQAMMGSDRKRELLGVLRKKEGLTPIGFFYEPNKSGKLS